MDIPGFDNLFSTAQAGIGISALIKMGIAAVLGGLIGYERELHGRPAGIRTHMLIAIGVVLFSEVSRAFDPDEPARVAAQILTGVGFLGAGTIMRQGAEIKGLTSAASIWAVAAIGMAVSAGQAFLWVAALATALTLVTLAVIDNLERQLVPHANAQNLHVELEPECNLGNLLMEVESEGGSLKAMRILAREPHRVLQLTIERASPELLARIAQAQGVARAHYSD